MNQRQEQQPTEVKTREREKKTSCYKLYQVANNLTVLSLHTRVRKVCILLNTSAISEERETPERIFSAQREYKMLESNKISGKPWR